MSTDRTKGVCKTYKGYKYGEERGVWVTIAPDGTKFIVSLDDSKSSGSRRHVEDANNEQSARDYIDWVTTCAMNA